MSPQDQLNQLERNIAAAKRHIAKSDALERLRKNPDFKALVLEGYLEQEAIRLVHLKGTDVVASPEKQAAIVRDLDAIASLVQYFNTIQRVADMAERGLVADEETMAELIQGGDA